MRLQTLSVQNFKNHALLRWEFHKPFVRFVGPNGVGKTNLLDAIYYLGLTKSYFHHSTDKENILHGQNFFRIEGEFALGYHTEKISCSFLPTGKKMIEKNGKKYDTFAQHIGTIPIVVLSPEDQNLIWHASGARRRFIDTTLAQCDAAYLQSLQKYNQILQSRNLLLKNATISALDTAYLDTLDEQLANWGEKIYEKRRVFIEKLQHLFAHYAQKLCQGAEEIQLQLKAHQQYEKLAVLLQKHRADDLKRQHTTHGAHKDDLIFVMNEKMLKSLASQGQQKTFVTALKLAQYDFLRAQYNALGANCNSPLLLIDDLFDKLDKTRLQRFLSLLPQSDPNNKGAHVFITHTPQQNHDCFDENLYQTIDLT